MQFQELQEQASRLRKEAQFAEALESYETLLTEHRPACGKWEEWGYAFCLRKVGRVDKALQICRHLYQTDPTFVQGADLYGWCVYDLEMRKSEGEIRAQPEIFFKAAQAIISLTKQASYSPYERTVFRVLEFLKTQSSPTAQKMLDWTSKLDPAHLASQATSYKDDGERKLEYASPLERWYNFRSRGMLTLGHFEECLRLCQEAFTQVTCFHNETDVWLRWRLAKCYIGLHQPQEALATLQLVVQRKHEWYMHYEIAKLLYDAGEPEQAFAHAASAVLGTDNVIYLWDLFLPMALTLRSRGDLDHARQHILLAAKLSLEKNQGIAPALLPELSALAIDAHALPSRQELIALLQPFWEASQPRYAGIVQAIQPNGKSGAIATDSGETYPFVIKKNSSQPDVIQQGVRVSFGLEPMLDPVTGQEAYCAVHIKPAY